MAEGKMKEDMQVREQAVSLVELFYDLVYVYAIARMTSLFHGPEGAFDVMGGYLLTSFAVLQAWMYMTNYINRFGRTQWRETAALVVNMCAALFLSNTISEDWGEMFPAFSASMLVILGTVALLYALRLRDGGSARGMAAYSLKTLLPVCAVYLVVAAAAPRVGAQLAAVLVAIAVLFGIFGPALVNRGTTLDLTLISFPHLAERFELITIVTFGEAVVTCAEVAEHFSFGAVSLATFGAFFALFGCYVVQMHNLVEHHQLRRGLRMIYCHFFIVIAVNLLTVSLNMLVEEGAPSLPASAIAAASLVGFFLCLMLLSKYHRADIHFGARDYIVIAVCALLGAGVAIAGLAGGAAVYAAGPLLAGVACFSWLLARDKGAIGTAAE